MEEKQLHPSLRNSLPLIVWPVIAIPAGLWLIHELIWKNKEVPVLVDVIYVAVLLAFPTWAWIKTRFHTYIIKPESVYSRRGLISRNYTEVRIPDIRAINVKQSGMQRIMGIGDVGFSTAAGDAEEVVFYGVADPEAIKNQVQMQQKQLEVDRKSGSVDAVSP